MGVFGGKGSWLVLLPILPFILVKNAIDRAKRKLGPCRHPRLVERFGKAFCGGCGARVLEADREEGP